MPNRKKPHKMGQKPLDRPARKKLSTASNEARQKESVKPRAVSKAEVFPLNSEELYPGLLVEPQNPEKPKRGRRTTADNFLVGFRNGWHSLLERFWHEIGWSLLEIRRRRTGTLDEIRKIFEPLQGKPNCYRADCFLRGSPQPVEGKELRINWKKASKLHDEIQRMHSQRQEMEFSCAQAESALKVANEQEKDAIAAEVDKRKGRLRELIENLQRAETESKELDTKVHDQETYVYCSQLLNILCNGKYAVEPFALSNALAGSPEIGWRQSLARCAKMQKSSAYPQYPYGIFLAISQIWQRKSRHPQLSVIELFRAEIPKIRKKNGETYSYLSEGWRDLRMALEECSKAEHSDEFMPYAITRAFLKNQSRSKTQADQIMDEHEKLSP
jgi:hypothetical protein